MSENLSQNVNKNVGVKVLSARLKKILKLLTTTLTPSLCNAEDHVANLGEIRQRSTDRDNNVGSS